MRLAAYYASEIGETEAGIGCVAVAIRHASRAVAAVSLTVPVDRLTPARIDELGQLLMKTLDERLPVPLSVALPD